MEECELNAVPDFEPEGPPEFSERNVYYTVPIEVSMVQARDSDIQALTSVLTKQNKKKKPEEHQETHYVCKSTSLQGTSSTMFMKPVIVSGIYL